jgi:hypothetical protein
MGCICPISLFFAAALLPFGALRADWRTDAGFPQLQVELGVALPTGAGIPVMMSEANVAAQSQPVVYAPQGTTGVDPYAGAGVLAGKTITPHSAASATSSHAAAVAGYFCGTAQSVSPGVTELHTWLADDFAEMLYFTNPPPVFAGSVQNHSWVGSFGSAAIDTEVLRRLDFIIARDGVTISTPMNNGSVMANLLANACHGISAGLRDDNGNANHPHTHSNLDVLGRMKPDLVVHEGVTSLASPAVASVAAFLLDAIRPAFPDADDPRVVKAIMLSAASKQNLLSWQRTSSSRPYDENYGAGELNVLNAYHILAAGRQTASGSALRALRGWDRGTSSTGTPQRYFFTVPFGQWGGTMAASITWHRALSPDFATATLANLNLRLLNAAGFVVGSTVTESVSAIDNVEHLFLRNLPPGDYALEVSADMAGVTYGIAWEVQSGTGPQLTLSRSGMQNVLTLSQLDPLETYTVESCTDLSDWLPATTIRTADTTPATSASWQQNVSAGARFYRLSWVP